MTPDKDFLRVCTVAALVPLLFGAYTLFEPFGRDQGIHATIAFALQERLATYRDVYNIKPPMTTATHWLALELFGHSYHAIRIFDLLYVCAAMASLAASVLLLGGSRALALGAAAGFSALFYAMGYWEHAQTDEWAALWLIFALTALALGWRQVGGPRRARWMALAGAAMGVAFCYKYTIGTAGLLVFAPLLVPGRDPRFSWRDLLWLIVGGLLCLGLVAGGLGLAGVLAPFLEIQDYIRGYVSYAQSVPTLVSTAFLLVWHAAPVNALLLAAGAVAFVATALRRWTVLHAIALVMTGTGMVSAVAQGKGFGYHYLPLFVGMGLVMGWGLEAIHTGLTRIAAFARRASLVWGVTIVGLGVAAGPVGQSVTWVGAVAVGQLSPRDIAMLYDGQGDYSFAATQAFSDRMSDIRKPDETFFLWGYETGLYFLQGQPPLHRFPYSWPFIVSFYDGRYTADLLVRLRADPPDYIVVQSGDAVPWVTANADDSRAALAKLPRIDGFVADGYVPVMRDERFELLKRAGAGGEAAREPGQGG